ncbi:MAG TPA: HAMP domain-containing sensor histidine kinase [Aliidongia sp.]|uniref:sensor histidine kinase n=1 Tax=Aliidongia sp. TaxID=1914230 RepID=UPI002DDD08E1|nr:HAMP domain-containing sensor histidine kinase [Aliidongia sp.]HEV2677899.1 HAMP domain-containing sensor histidine kinase [Aliidongia sp.]
MTARRGAVMLDCGTMNRPILSLPPLARSLSARLLVLTVAFVMISEVLIFVPSVSHFRESYLEDKLAAGTLALLALEATPDNMVSQELADQLLHNVGAFSAMPEDMGRLSSSKLKGVLALEMPPEVQRVVDLRDETMFAAMRGAMMTLFRRGDRVMMVIGKSPREPQIELDVTLPERPLREAMIAFARNLFEISLVISAITAALVYVTLQWLLVRPMRQLSENMIAFREDPEDASRVIRPGGRRDEIGVAQRELAHMQEAVRQAISQHARLAALGTAVTKVNHDLRNMLSTALVVSDRIAETGSPEIRRMAPALVNAIERATKLCTGTLAYTREGAPPLTLVRFPLSPLIDEIEAALPSREDHRIAVDDDTQGAVIGADRDQLYRLLLNLARNAAESGADRIRFRVQPGAVRGVAIEIADDGPGLPPKARDNLFKPFAGSARPGGTGLGLAIGREIARAHGGDLVLVDSAGSGTIFRLTLPQGWVEGATNQQLAG